MTALAQIPTASQHFTDATTLVLHNWLADSTLADLDRLQQRTTSADRTVMLALGPQGRQEIANALTAARTNLIIDERLETFSAPLMQQFVDALALKATVTAVSNAFASVDQTLTGKSNIGHHHPMTDIDGLGGALAQKADAAAVAQALAGRAPALHSHAMADITGLIEALSAKAGVQHTHVIADIVGLATALAGKVDTATLTTALAARPTPVTPYRIELQQTAAQSLPINTSTALTFQTVVGEMKPDTDSLFSTAATDRVTIRRAGWYSVAGFARLSGIAITGEWRMEVVRNGAPIAGESLSIDVSLASRTPALSASWNGYCALNDIVQIKVTNAALAAVSTQTARLSVVEMGGKVTP